jgi:hypothetical protein
MTTAAMSAGSMTVGRGDQGLPSLSVVPGQGW